MIRISKLPLSSLSSLYFEFVSKVNLITREAMAGKQQVPANYFLYPELLAFILFPVTWGLLPIAAFQPQLLQVYLPPQAYVLIAGKTVRFSALK